MSTTLLQANTFAGDLRDALQLLSGRPAVAAPSGGPPRDMWATVEMSEADALRLAPQLATMLGRRVVVTTVDEPRCWVTLAAPTGEVIGPIDGREGGRVEEFASTFGDSRLPRKRREAAWPVLLTGALGDQRLPAAVRHAAAARVLGLPVPPSPAAVGSSLVPQSATDVGSSPLPRTGADESELQARYRRRRVARRARTGVGGLAVAAGVAASIAWTDADFGRLGVFGGVMVVLVLGWLLLRRALR
jgi:hypothetical protein